MATTQDRQQDAAGTTPDEPAHQDEDVTTRLPSAEAMAAGDFSRRVPVGPKSEFGRLGHSFNVMSAKVEDGYARLDDASSARDRISCQ